MIAAREAREYARNASKTKKRSPELTTTISTPVHIGPLDDFLPPKTRETVRLENENGQSLFEVKKNKPIEGILENFLMPKPLVDRISDDEKYGNAGDKFIGVGRALVNGFEGLSNIINKIIDVSVTLPQNLYLFNLINNFCFFDLQLPGRAVKNSSRSLTSALNQVGGKLIGLE